MRQRRKCLSRLVQDSPKFNVKSNAIATFDQVTERQKVKGQVFDSAPKGNYHTWAPTFFQRGGRIPQKVKYPQKWLQGRGKIWGHRGGEGGTKENFLRN